MSELRQVSQTQMNLELNAAMEQVSNNLHFNVDYFKNVFTIYDTGLLPLPFCIYN